MGRERRKRHRSFDKGDDRRQNMDVEVLIAHDPMMPVDSDEELDLLPHMSRSSSAGSGDRKRESHSSASASAQKTKKKKEKKETKKKDVNINEDGVDNEEVFYVEKIKDKRWNGRWEWLIQWEGYGP